MSDAKSLFIGNLVQLADLFCASTGQSRSSVAKAIHGRGGQIDDLEAGKRDLTTRSAEDAMRWFADRWPAGLDWPADIARPQPQSPAATDIDDFDAAAPAAVVAGPVCTSRAGAGAPIHKFQEMAD